MGVRYYDEIRFYFAEGNQGGCQCGGLLLGIYLLTYLYTGRRYEREDAGRWKFEVVACG